MVSTHSQNTAGVCNQITLLILYYINSRLVTRLKIIVPSLQVSNIVDLTVSFKFVSFNFQIFLLFSVKCTLASRFTLIYYPRCFGLGSETIAFYPAVFDLKNINILHQTMVYAASIRTGLFFLMFFLLLSQALFMSSLELKFSKAAYLFQILI